MGRHRKLASLFLVILLGFVLPSHTFFALRPVHAQTPPTPPEEDGEEEFERRVDYWNRYLYEHSDTTGRPRPDLWLAGVLHTKQMQIAPTIRGNTPPLPPLQNTDGSLGPNKTLAGSIVNGQWVQIGPQPLRIDAEQNFQGTGPDSGAVTDIAIDPSGLTDQIIYIATNDGGIWKTTNGGTSWTPKTDFMPSLSMGDVTLDPTNPSIVYAGTGNLFDGSGQFNNRGFRGIGIYRSTNGGDSWQIRGSESLTGHGINRIVLPATEVLVVATDAGIFRSVDGGQNFGANAPLFNDRQPIISGFISDLDQDTANPNRIYASVSGTGILVSTDGGVTFPAASNLFTAANGAPAAGTFAFTTFAQSTQSGGAANGNTMYALVQNTANSRRARLFRSTNAGANWVDTEAGSGATTRSAENNGCQCSYDQTLGVDPRDPTRVYIGFQELYISTDSGVTFGTPAVSRNKIHWDHHALIFSPSTHWPAAPATPTRVWAGHDGGVSASTDAGATWANLNETIATNLFFAIDIGRGSAGNRQYTYGGTQDTGTVQRKPADPGNEWHLGVDGDGGFVAVDPNDPTRAYGTDNGSFMVTTNSGGTWTFPAGTGLPAGAVGRLGVDPTSSMRIYATSGALLFQSTNQGATFTQIRSFPQNITALGLTTNANVIWVGLADSTTQRTANALMGAASTWTSLPVQNALNQPVLGIAVDPTNTSEAVVVYPGFSGINPAARTRHVFRTTDTGATWTDISGTNGGDPLKNLPDLPLHSVVIDPGATPHRIIVSSDSGVMMTSDLGATWQVLGIGLPTVLSKSLAIDTSIDPPLLRVGTYGRSVFELNQMVDVPPTLSFTDPGMRGSVRVTVLDNAGLNSLTCVDNRPGLTLQGAGLGTTAVRDLVYVGAGWHIITCTATDTINQVTSETLGLFVIGSSYAGSQTGPPLDFASAGVVPCTRRTIIIHNDGNQVFSLGASTTGGTNQNDFRVYSGFGAVGLQPAQGRVVIVQFCATNVGTRNALFTFTGRLGTGPTAPTTIPLTGTGN